MAMRGGGVGMRGRDVACVGGGAKISKNIFFLKISKMVIMKKKMFFKRSVA